MKNFNKTIIATAIFTILSYGTVAQASSCCGGHNSHGQPSNTTNNNGYGGKGGSAKQGQVQGQIQGQISINKNSNRNTNLNANLNKNTNSNSNTAGALSVSGIKGSGNSNSSGNKSNQDQSQSATSAGNETAVNTDVTYIESNGLHYSGSYKVKNTPDVVGAALTTSNGTCMGSSSAGGSAPGIGLSFGTTWTDEECTARYNAEIMYNMGFREVSLKIMCQLDDVARAAGDLCTTPSKKVVGVSGKRADGVIVTIPSKSNTKIQSVTYEQSNGFF